MASLEEPEETIQDLYSELSHAHMLLEQSYQQLADEYRKEKNHLSYIQPIYEQWYSRWWMRLFMPYDPYLEDRKLMRCNTCKELFWEDDPKTFTVHKTHYYGYAQGGTRWEMIRLKMGWIK